MFLNSETTKEKMFAINLRGGAPIYEQLKQVILENALLGVLEPEEQLPSVRQLSKELGVNPNTVQKAYHALESEGIIYSLSGKGSFISPDVRQLPVFRRTIESKLKPAVREALMAGYSPEELMGFVEEEIKAYQSKAAKEEA